MECSESLAQARVRHVRVPVADATTLAKEYGLTKFASELVRRDHLYNDLSS